MIKDLLSEWGILPRIIVIIAVTLILANAFRYFTSQYLKKHHGNEGIDETGLIFIKKFILGMIYVLGFSFALVQIPKFKDVGNSLLAGAGILSLVVGLASQQALSNVASGFLIVLFKPFKLNDKITFSDKYTGIVEEINLRQVVIRDSENNRVVVPNSVISTGVIINENRTEENVKKAVQIGIGYNSSISKALQIMEEETSKHPLFIDNRTEEDKKNNVPEVVSRVVSLDNSSVSLKVWGLTANSSDAFVLYCDVLRSVKERFDTAGIEMPYNYQNVIIKKEESS